MAPKKRKVDTRIQAAWSHTVRARVLRLISSGKVTSTDKAVLQAGGSMARHKKWLQLESGQLPQDAVGPREYALALQWGRDLREARTQAREAHAERMYEKAVSAAEEGLEEVKVYQAWEARPDHPDGGVWVDVKRIVTRQPSEAMIRYLHTNLDKAFFTERSEVREAPLTRDEMLKIRREATAEELDRMRRNEPPGDGAKAMAEVMARLGMKG